MPVAMEVWDASEPPTLPVPAEILSGHSLDPADWPAFRRQAHAMLDDLLGSREHP
jgi:hypothetical protein